jgi:hypothetical protein
MVRRVVFSLLSLFLAGSAFWSADPVPDVNLFGVMFLFFAFVVWFYWPDIEAGYSYFEDSGVPRYETTGLLFIRFAPMYLHELSWKKRRQG